MKTASLKIQSVAPVYGRCLRVNTNHGEIDLKVLGEDDRALGLRNQLLTAFAAAGLKVQQPQAEQPKPAKRSTRQ
jgi:hypothetical protein